MDPGQPWIFQLGVAPHARPSSGKTSLNVQERGLLGIRPEALRPWAPWGSRGKPGVTLGLVAPTFELEGFTFEPHQLPAHHHSLTCPYAHVVIQEKISCTKESPNFCSLVSAVSLYNFSLDRALDVASASVNALEQTREKTAMAAYKNDSKLRSSSKLL